MKRFYLLFIFFPYWLFAQGIVVDTTSQSVPQLVQTTLFSGACISVSNVQHSSHKGIGYFTNSNSNFPLGSGIVLRSGNASYTSGPYSDTNLNSQLNNNTDADLQSISNKLGGLERITDVGYITFEFTPISNQFSFDFIFASNEYGDFQCKFSDIFAFLLTDLTTNTTNNLAVLPSTTTPISVNSIRNNAYNGGCSSSNPDFFNNYNVNSTNSATNMRGETAVLTASANVIPNRTYRLKIAIGDYKDGNYDSAVFLKGGSFKNSIDLGKDTAICDGETLPLSTGLDATEYDHVWYKDNIILTGENNNVLNVTQPAIYRVVATKSGTSCAIEDEIKIDLTTFNTSPSPLLECYNNGNPVTFDLAKIKPENIAADPAIYNLEYYEDAATTNKITNTSFSSNGQTIYIKAINKQRSTSCSTVIPIDLIVNPEIKLTQPNVIKLCSDTEINNRASIKLSNYESFILNGANSNNFVFTYYLTQANAINKLNGQTNDQIITTNTKQFWVRVTEIATGCYNLVTLDFELFAKPLITTLPNAVACTSYELPPLANGDYYTEPNGGGTKIVLPYTVTSSDTFYIFVKDANGCTNQSNFLVRLINDYVIESSYCGVFTVPVTPENIGDFYTEPGGKGTKLATGTQYGVGQHTIYYYAVIDGVPCRDVRMDVEVFPLPDVSDVPDVITCDSYTITSLPNKGKFYTASNGQGVEIPLNTQITYENIILPNGIKLPTSQLTKLYVFVKDPATGCTNESETDFVIVNTSLYQPITICDVFELPEIPSGGYYTQANGGGTAIPAKTVITDSAVVYYFARTTTFPNCTTNLKYDITIKKSLEVNAPMSQKFCGTFVLPTLLNGDYFTEKNGGGIKLNPSEYNISPNSTYDNVTLYAYAEKDGCITEKSFSIDAREKPTLTFAPNNLLICDPTYTLPTLTDGTYYDAPFGPFGTGKPITNLVLSKTQKVYIFKGWNDFPDCYIDHQFEVQIANTTLDNIGTVYICDYFTLPNLQNGNYFLKKQKEADNVALPEGSIVSLNDIITPDGTRIPFAIPSSIFQYVRVGDDRSFCENEASFRIEPYVPPIATFEVSKAFDPIPFIKIIIPNETSFKYEIDNNGTFQESPIFYTVSSGAHYISFQDKFSNCPPSKIGPIYIIDYPKFFTPNGDGVNDNWNITDLSFAPKTTINIFDRYGKLVKQIFTGEAGWDGTFNGKELPSTDYWFQIKFLDEKNNHQEYRAHFTLKR